MYRLLCVALVLAGAGPAMAGTLGLPNEIPNGNFETGDFTGWGNTGCSVLSQGDWSVPQNATGDQKWAGMVTSWAGDWNAPVGVLRQVIDESQFPGWDPAGTGKTIDLEFDYFLNATNSWEGEPWRDVALKVYLDWDSAGGWPDPASPTYQRLLVFEETRNANVADPAWQHADLLIDLPVQTQFLSLEIEAHAHFAEWSFVGVDNVDLESQTVPEPPVLVLVLAAGLVVLRRPR